MMSFISGFLPPWMHILIAVGSFGGLSVLGIFAPAYKPLIKYAAIGVAACFLWYAGFHRATETGKQNLTVQMAADKKKFDDRETEYKLATLTANGIAAEKTQALQLQINTITTDFNKLTKAYDEKVRTVIKDSQPTFTVGKDSSGNDTISSTGGLSISAFACSPTKPGTSNGVQAPSDPTVTGWPEPKVEARLNGKTSGDLISLIAAGDAAIIQLNAVIDAYAKVQASGCTIDKPK